MKYEVILIGGEKDGQTIGTFDNYDEAYDFTKAYHEKHEHEFHPVWGGVTIINERGVNIGW